MRKLLTITLLIGMIASLWSCSENAPSELSLFNGLSLNLKTEEKDKRITNDSKDLYSRLTDGIQKQVPLFKYIENKKEGYELFLAIPVGISVQEAGKINLLPEATLTSNTDNKKFVYQYYDTDSITVATYFMKSKTGNTFYLLGYSQNSSNIDSVFSEKALSARIQD